MRDGPSRRRGRASRAPPGPGRFYLNGLAKSRMIAMTSV